MKYSGFHKAGCHEKSVEGKDMIEMAEGCIESQPFLRQVFFV